MLYEIKQYTLLKEAKVTEVDLHFHKGLCKSATMTLVKNCIRLKKTSEDLKKFPDITYSGVC